jgi:glycosyltransferase involved in cell wall biosynthesis
VNFTIDPSQQSQSLRAKSVFFSIVIPTYNRLPILQKCVSALEIQTFDALMVTDYEIVIVDDGSTDGTIEWLKTNTAQLPHVKIYEQAHQGASAARNLGVERATGDTIIFIDSDLVVTPIFLQSHADGLLQGQKRLGNDKLFTYGAVINTANFEDPTSEAYKIMDFSNAYFATGNVAIARHWLLEVGLFDLGFSLYGWEDLELGVRLKNKGIEMVKCWLSLASSLLTRSHSPSDRAGNRARQNGCCFLSKASNFRCQNDGANDCLSPNLVEYFINWWIVKRTNDETIITMAGRSRQTPISRTIRPHFSQSV